MGDWFECCRVSTGVGIFASFGARKLAGDDQGGQELLATVTRGSVSFRSGLGSRLCVSGAGAKASHLWPWG